MDKEAKILRKRQQRHTRETNARVDQFIAQYVQRKYNNIHVEAKEFHDRLKSIYPYKHDLRKTTEYGLWEKQICMEKTNVCEEPATHTTEEPEPREITYRDNLELKIPLIRYESKNKSPETVTEETFAKNKSPETVTEETFAKNKSPETVTEETFAVDTPETVMENFTLDNIQPSVYQDISPDIIEKVIEELRAETGLNDIFTDIEQDLLFEELGMDLPEPIDMIEKELEN